MTEIQEAMFVFDNLIKSDDKSLQMILRSVETEDLVLAMKGADEVLRDSFSLVCPKEQQLTYKTKWKRLGL